MHQVIHVYQNIASNNVHVLFAESYWCLRISVILKKIISKRKIIFTSSKNCFIMCSGSWPGFFSVTFGLAFRLKISGCRSLVNPGSTSVDDSAVVILFSLKKRNFKVHWRVILNNESNNRSHILGSFGSVCPLPYHIR